MTPTTPAQREKRARERRERRRLARELHQTAVRIRAHGARLCA